MTIQDANNQHRVEYYSTVLDTLKRYIRAGHPLALATDFEDARTAITFRLDSSLLSPYMASLDTPHVVHPSGAFDGTVQFEVPASAELAPRTDEPAAVRLNRSTLLTPDLGHSWSARRCPA